MPSVVVCVRFLEKKEAKKARVGSQGNLDTILDQVFHRIGETNRYYVEFGFDSRDFAQGGSGSNAFMLHQRGWTGKSTLLEIDVQVMRLIRHDMTWTGLLLDSRNRNPHINLHRAFITSENIVPLFRTHGVPMEPDFVSIDIDSTDLWVMRAILTDFKPRVVTVEVNANYPMSMKGALTFPDPTRMPVSPGKDTWDYSCYFGASLTPALSPCMASSE